MSEEFKVKSSGSEDNYDTGAKRDKQSGKGRMDLLPVDAVIEVSQIFEAGANRYAERNWELGIPLSRYIDSGLRHGFKVLRGDADENHAAMAAWNWLCFIQTRKWIAEGILPPELDNLPERVKIIVKK